MPAPWRMEGPGSWWRTPLAFLYCLALLFVITLYEWWKGRSDDYSPSTAWSFLRDYLHDLFTPTEEELGRKNDRYHHPRSR